MIKVLMPIATIIKMAGFVPIGGQLKDNRRTGASKKSLLKKYFTRTSSVSGTKRKGK
jgi:hypothetical protein